MAKWLTQEWLDEGKKLAEGQPERPGASVRGCSTSSPAGPTATSATTGCSRTGSSSSLVLGELPDAEVTLTESYEDAMRIQKNELDANAAFMQGRVKVTGNMAKLMAMLPITNSAEYKQLLVETLGDHRVLINCTVPGASRSGTALSTVAHELAKGAVAEELHPGCADGLGKIRLANEQSRSAVRSRQSGAAARSSGVSSAGRRQTSVTPGSSPATSSATRASMFESSLAPRSLETVAPASARARRRPVRARQNDPIWRHDPAFGGQATGVGSRPSVVRSCPAERRGRRNSSASSKKTSKNSGLSWTASR